MSIDSSLARLGSALRVAIAAIFIASAETVASISTGTVPAAVAQDRTGAPAAPGHGGHRMGKILMQLNLTDAQKTQIRGIMLDAHKQNQSVTDRDTRRANMKAAYAKIDTVLTPDQRTELHAKLDAMRQQNPDAHAQ